jgi:ubiquinol-cytochrome c reductase iron-sulfur subunit
MSDKEFIEPGTRRAVATRRARPPSQAFRDANEESGFGRRTAIRGSLIAALVASILPGITLFRGLAPESSPENPIAGDPVALLSHTMWKKGMRLAHDPSGEPIRAADLTLGSAVHVIPEELASLSHHDGYLEEKAKAIVLLMRLLPEQLPAETTSSSGRTTASSRTRRSARTSDAPWPSTSSRRTTCSAPATSRSSTSPLRGGHLRPGRASAAAAAHHGR